MLLVDFFYFFFLQKKGDPELNLAILGATLSFLLRGSLPDSSEGILRIKSEFPACKLYTQSFELSPLFSCPLYFSNPKANLKRNKGNKIITCYHPSIYKHKYVNLVKDKHTTIKMLLEKACNKHFHTFWSIHMSMYVSFMFKSRCTNLSVLRAVNNSRKGKYLNILANR